MKTHILFLLSLITFCVQASSDDRSILKTAFPHEREVMERQIRNRTIDIPSNIRLELFTPETAAELSISTNSTVIAHEALAEELLRDINLPHANRSINRQDIVRLYFVTGLYILYFYNN
jgi:hypothetical protein